MNNPVYISEQLFVILMTIYVVFDRIYVGILILKTQQGWITVMQQAS